MNRDALTAMLASASEIYERELTSLMVAAYRDALAGTSEADLTAAFQAHLRDPRAGSFFPKPADILRQLASIRAASAGPDFDALMGWACYGDAHSCSPESRTLFARATNGASTFDMRRWGYTQWDEARTRYLKLAAAEQRQAPALAGPQTAQLEGSR